MDDTTFQVVSGRKIFLLCVGAQKSGTTWLADYLRHHPNTDMGFAKEYHVFDALYVEECSGHYDSRIQEGLRQLTANPPFSPGSSHVFKLLDFLNNIDSYFIYFFRVARSSPRIVLTGDMTPAYCALPQHAFQMIRTKLLQYGFEPRVVFLMRDPVERCISAMRRELRKEGIVATADSEQARLLQSYSERSTEMRTRYDLTVKNIESVFTKEEVHYESYENLFNETSMRSLCNFLEINYKNPDFTKNPNPSNYKNIIPIEIRKKIFDHYSDVYQCQSAFKRDPVSASNRDPFGRLSW